MLLNVNKAPPPPPPPMSPSSPPPDLLPVAPKRGRSVGNGLLDLFEEDSLGIIGLLALLCLSQQVEHSGEGGRERERERGGGGGRERKRVGEREKERGRASII